MGGGSNSGLKDVFWGFFVCFFGGGRGLGGGQLLSCRM